MGTFLTVMLVLMFVVIPVISGKKNNGNASRDTREKRPVFESGDENFDDSFVGEQNTTEKEQFLYEEYNEKDVARHRNDNGSTMVVERKSEKETSEKAKSEFNLRDAVVYSVILQNPYTGRN